MGAIPVIVLSARSEKAMPRLLTPELMITCKPFGIGELQARCVCRAATTRHRQPLRRSDRPLFHGVTVDLAARLIHRGDEEIHLTPIEFRLLAVLLNNTGKVLT